MKINSLYKIILGASAMLFLGTASVFATTDQENEALLDTVPPVFSENIKQRYVLKKAEDGSQFIPENYIKDIKATDDVDGKNVKIEMVDHNVDLSSDGIYQVLYTATDSAGNTSAICVEVIVDGIAPTFSESVETLYYINHEGIIFDSNHNKIENLPEMITATDALGAYAGIGIYLTDIDDQIVFIQKMEDTPADKVLKVNDVLLSVDGENVQGKTAAYAASKIKGQEGTVVTLEILRDGQKKTVSIQREIIKLYGEEDCIAEPDVDITSIDMNNDGIIEVTYTATDQAGNTATITVKIVVGETDVDATTNDDEQKEDEDIEKTTTGGNPPEDEDLDKDIIENKEFVDEENNKIETNTDTELDKTAENTNTESQEIDKNTITTTENNLEN